MQTTEDETPATPISPSQRSVITEPNFEQPLKSITELAACADFPECAFGELVDIGGFTGVVVEIVHQSLKVRSADHMTRSFKVYTLRKLYGPALPPEVVDTSVRQEVPAIREPASRVPIAEPPAPVIKKPSIPVPNFDGPLKDITEFAGRADFPECAFGVFMDIGGFKGGIVEVVKGSIKVRSPEETTRSYNLHGLRKLYGQK